MSVDYSVKISGNGAADVLEKLTELPESPQTVIDVLFAALILAETVGFKEGSLYETVPVVYKKAKEFVQVFLPEEEYFDD